MGSASEPPRRGLDVCKRWPRLGLDARRAIQAAQGRAGGALTSRDEDVVCDLQPTAGPVGEQQYSQLFGVWEDPATDAVQRHVVTKRRDERTAGRDGARRER